MKNRSYIVIDLKSFYASVECVERGLDPLTANLVVADESRTEKTICLAVSPSLKKYGIPGRARLFEVIQRCKEIKASTGKTVEYIAAVPRMQLYIDYSAKIYNVYLKYVSAEDIHVYSIDEVFIDVTDYMHLYRDDEGNVLSAKKLAARMIKDVYDTTGITATAGVGTNLYLAKIAMDIVSKHVEEDEDGVRVAELNEDKYRRLLWEHRPLTDFWRIGRGIAKRLEKNGMFTMGDIARMSTTKIGEDFLFKLFGVDAEILIDHAWGMEPCTMKDIKNYKPSANSLSSGQVLSCGYDFDKARIIVREMLELLALELVSKKLVTDLVVLDVGYDRELPEGSSYDGEMVLDHYGRTVPKPAHGSYRLKEHTSVTSVLNCAVLEIYDRQVNRTLNVKRVTVALCNIVAEPLGGEEKYEQLDLFTDYTKKEEENKRLLKERNIQEAMLSVQSRYGKNAMLRGTNLQEGATTVERNRQIGGHKA